MQVFNIELEVGDHQDIGGLGVFPLTGTPIAGPPYLTGPEAFEAGLIEVSELDPPEVPSLLVSNLADVPILLVEGEMLVGGDQNRTMNVTVLCPPKSVIIVPVSCVEAGRWGARRAMSASSRHAPGSLRSIKTSTLEARGEHASDRRSDQGRVWEEVTRQSEVHSRLLKYLSYRRRPGGVRAQHRRGPRSDHPGARPDRRGLHHRWTRWSVSICSTSPRPSPGISGESWPATPSTPTDQRTRMTPFGPLSAFWPKSTPVRRTAVLV